MVLLTIQSLLRKDEESKEHGYGDAEEAIKHGMGAMSAEFLTAKKAIREQRVTTT